MIRIRVAIPVRLALLLSLLLTPALAAAPQSKPALDHAAYEIWKGIDDQEISRDGAWVLYSVTLQDGDPTLVVRSLGDDREYRVERGTRAAFDAAVRHVITMIQPSRADARQARLDDVEDDLRPKASLGILDLNSGELTVIERVKSYRLPEDAGDWLAYLMEKPLPPAAEESGDTAAGAVDDGEPAAEGDDSDGTTLVRRQLAAGDETIFDAVQEYAVAAAGTWLAFWSAGSDSEPAGLFVVAADGAGASAVLAGEGEYQSLTFDDAGVQLAFVAKLDEGDENGTEFKLYRSESGGTAAVVAAEGTAGLPVGWWVSEYGEVQFSEDGTRLFFATAPRPEPEPEREEMLEEEKVKIDVWHWQDPLLQPMQLLQAEDEEQRSYLAVVHIADSRVVQLAGTRLPDVDLLDPEATIAHGSSFLPYRKEISWEFPRFVDHYAVDLSTGARTEVREAQQGPFQMSPDGRWAVWWDATELAWFGGAIDLAAPAPTTGANLTAVIGVPVHDEDHDWAYRPMPYGLAGWLHDTEGNVEVVIYDRYDMWAVDPSGQGTPRHITSGAGRDLRTELRWLDLDPEEDWMPGDSLLLAAFNETTKDSGFWRVQAYGTTPPENLVMMPRRFGRPSKADDAAVLMFTREDVAEFPNLWTSGLDPADMRRISDANPQQADYNWATAELTSWRSLDGEVLQGLIHKPEDFDPSRKYPMMVTFYERNSDNLHAHYPPVPHRSVIRATFYASRGYVVFTPDITYQVGYPGESALKDVVSGVLHMIDQGYVDERNIGTQGHSWGGYQIAYMVTKTNIFKAAAGGAPVSNMTSAYGGIRWSSGMSRMFQYERTQSRLGSTLWEAPMRYLENSPLFWADKVETPLMMMHNDHDGAVPWYQGIEMFVALRRLGKPAWLINYNDEPHWPTSHANKVDWNIRMQQFFDHYLMGEPAPRWLAEGIPATRKGKTLGLELVDQDRR